jgi:hypothetical protein
MDDDVCNTEDRQAAAKTMKAELAAGWMSVRRSMVKKKEAAVADWGGGA